MLIASLQNLQPIDHTAAFPNTSFSVSGPNDAFLTEQGYVKVNLFKPHDRATQKLVPVAPYYEEPWVYTVDVADKTAEELQQETDDKAAEVRAQRNALLADCDWTQLADAPVDSQVWAAYRQALRDITDQPGFPWNIVWPE
jgi:hypothetical protein